MYQTNKASSALEPALITLKSNEVHLWLVNEEDVMGTDAIKDFLAVISQDEKKRMSAFKSIKRKRQFLIARATLRYIVSFYTLGVLPGDLRFTANRFGKPALEDKSYQLQFNLSHSNGKTLIGIASKRSIGVDIESMSNRRDIFKIADYFFHQNEWNTDLLQDQAEPEKLFYKLWTLKEAFIKAEGKGLFIAGNQFYFDNGWSDSPELVITAPELRSTKSWIFEHIFLASDYSLAFALENTGNDKSVEISARQYVHANAFSPIILR